MKLLKFRKRNEHMKKFFETPECTVIEFDNEDIITTSNELPDVPIVP